MPRTRNILVKSRQHPHLLLAQQKSMHCVVHVSGSWHALERPGLDHSQLWTVKHAVTQDMARAEEGSGSNRSTGTTLEPATVAWVCSTHCVLVVDVNKNAFCTNSSTISKHNEKQQRAAKQCCCQLGKHTHHVTCCVHWSACASKAEWPLIMK
jgi:hypothetical protein